MKFPFFAIIVTLLCLNATTACADDLSAQLIFRGTFRGPFEKQPIGEPLPNVRLGHTWIGPRPRQETGQVTGTRGLQFGVLFIPRDSKPMATPVSFRYVIRYPQPGVIQPGSAVPSLSAETKVDCLVGLACIATYTFDNDWEIVPGTWRFEIYDKDLKIVDESIEVLVQKTSQ